MIDKLDVLTALMILTMAVAVLVLCLVLLASILLGAVR